MQPRDCSSFRFALMLVATFAPLSAQVIHGQDGFTPEQLEAAMSAARASVNERLQIAVEAYSLDGAKSAELRAWADGNLPAQVEYMSRQDATLRRRSQALSSMVQAMQNVTEEQRQQIIDRMQGQIYRIYANAPLSLANVVRHVESTSTQEAVKLGREAIARKYAAQLKGEALAIADIDRLIIPPVEYDPNAQQVFAVRPDKAEALAAQQARVKEKRDAAAAKNRAGVNGKADQSLTKGDDGSTALPPPTPPAKRPLKAPKPLPPAPPVTEWELVVHDAAERYGFDQMQRDSAMSACKSCKLRAIEHRDANKEAYQQAEQNTDDVEKRRAMKDLDVRIDQLYAELLSRVDNIATLEQKNRAAADDKSKDAKGTASPGS